MIIISLCCFVPYDVCADELDIHSQNMVLYQLNEDKIINEKNKDERISVASLTKIMTAYVAIQHIQNLDEQVKLTNQVFQGLAEANAAVVGFQVGETVTYRDLLYGTLLASGADAANALAIFSAGNLSTFINWMNEEARILGLKNTHFTNPIGLDDNEHYSSVNDIAILLKQALQNQIFYDIFTSSNYTTSDYRLSFSSTLRTTLNRFHLNGNYILGAKTGFTYDAGRCLASIAYDDTHNITYLLVTAKAPTTTNYYHIEDAIHIYDYYFENYGYQKIVKKGDLLATLNVKYSKIKQLNIYATEDILYYLKNDDFTKNINMVYSGISNISPQNEIGTQLGNVNIYYKNSQIVTIPILLNQTISYSVFGYVQEHTIEFLLLIFLMLLIVIFIVHKFRKS